MGFGYLGTMTRTTRTVATIAALTLTISMTACSSTPSAEKPATPTATATTPPTPTPTPEVFDAAKLDQMTLNELLNEFSSQKSAPNSIEVLEITQRLITRTDTECKPTLEGKQLLGLLETKATADKETTALGEEPNAKSNGMGFYLTWAPYAALVDGLCGPNSR